MISPIQSHYYEGSPISKEEKLRWEGYVEMVGFEHRVKEWRSDGCWEWPIRYQKLLPEKKIPNCMSHSSETGRLPMCFGADFW